MPAPNADASMKKVLVTGAAGRIGSYFAEQNAGRYRLRLMDRPGNEKLKAMAGLGETVEADLADLNALRSALDGCDACLHLAGDPSAGAAWQSLLETNIVGTYNLFVTALAAGCKRVVYASSIHAVSGYPADVQVKTTEPINPGDLYGVSKCFGEALARYVAEQEGMSAVAVRIGAYQPHEKIVEHAGVTLLDAWVSRRDLNQLLALALDATNVRYAVVHGVSDNRFKRLDITSAREILGYAPQDDAANVNAELKPLQLNENKIAHSLSDSPDHPASSGLRDELNALKDR